MNYKQLNEKMKAQIDILLESGCSMREVGRIMNISHSTVSRYKNGVYKKRTIDIHKKHPDLIKYLHDQYDWKECSVDVCIYKFKRYHRTKPCVSTQQVYNWINKGKMSIQAKDMCYKRSNRKKRSSAMMNHVFGILPTRPYYPLV